MNIPELREIARIATREALRAATVGHEIPSAFWDRLARSEGELNRQRLVFEIYVPGIGPADAVVVARTVVDRSTGLVEAETFIDRILDAMKTEPPVGRGIDF